METGGARSMRPDRQAGSDQGGTQARGAWRGQGWSDSEHEEAAGQGRPGQGRQQGPTLVSGQGSEVPDKNDDRGKPGDRRHGKKDRKFGT